MGIARTTVVASPWLASTLASSSDELQSGTGNQPLQWRSSRVHLHRSSPFASLSCSWNVSKSLAPLGSVSMFGPAVANALGSAATPSQSSKEMTVDLSGTWFKDKERSDSMDEAIKLMALGGVMRQAIRLIRGVQIKQDQQQFEMAVFSVLSWFKVRERYSMDGGVSRCRRRDFRRGGHQGRLQPLGDKLLLHLTWEEPYGGTGTDEFSLVGPDELRVRSSIQVRGSSAAYTSVYRRKR